APCRAEMPDINTVYQDLRAKQPNAEQGLALVTVSIGEEPGAVRKYLDTTRYPFMVLVDPSFDITEQYRITGLPTHYFIGADGGIGRTGASSPRAQRGVRASCATPVGRRTGPALRSGRQFLGGPTVCDARSCRWESGQA